MSQPSAASPLPRVPLQRFDPGIAPEQAARAHFESMRLRRSVRDFSDRPVSQETIEWIIRTAASAPSGAHKQPWSFVAVSDPQTKSQIRVAAEAEEREFYARRASPEWLADLAPLGTDTEKPFLEVAPWLIVVFKQMKDTSGDHASDQVYYVNESVGIACGFLIAAIHMAGLVTLTHTPSPMGFLPKILGRPAHERPFLLLPVGYPANDCTVPSLRRKSLDDILTVR
ncbi:MAG: nitroreductase family protein [Planctomycetota bacterium]|nr:nitroreductase family protein [Planctomycetota bacterium]MDA1105202.1 nitroreductase family protein [Planctomycetota bacterium]